jgi:hypothetical protein
LLLVCMCAVSSCVCRLHFARSVASSMQCCVRSFVWFSSGGCELRAGAGLGMVDNWANGLSDKPLTLEEFRALVKQNESHVERLVQTVLKALGPL